MMIPVRPAFVGLARDHSGAISPWANVVVVTQIRKTYDYGSVDTRQCFIWTVGVTGFDVWFA